MSRSQDWDNLIKSKPKQIMKLNSQWNTILNDATGRKKSIKKTESTGLTC
jgi:hypothetical protein